MSAYTFNDLRRLSATDEPINGADLVDSVPALLAERDALLRALRQIATADYTRIDVATLGNIARAAVAAAEVQS